MPTDDNGYRRFTGQPGFITATTAHTAQRAQTIDEGSAAQALCTSVAALTLTHRAKQRPCKPHDDGDVDERRYEYVHLRSHASILEWRADGWACYLKCQESDAGAGEQERATVRSTAGQRDAMASSGCTKSTHRATHVSMNRLCGTAGIPCELMWVRFDTQRQRNDCDKVAGRKFAGRAARRQAVQHVLVRRRRPRVGRVRARLVSWREEHCIERVAASNDLSGAVTEKSVTRRKATSPQLASRGPRTLWDDLSSHRG